MKTKTSTPEAIIIYGMVAVGKLTVAKALQEQLGYKLTHNHLINDLVWSIFDRATLEANALIEKMRFELYQEAVKRGTNIIVTHCYSHDFVSPTGLSDPDYLKMLESKLEKAGAKTLFVHLQADRQALLDRVQGESRKSYKKMTDPSKLEKYLDAKDFDAKTSASVKNNLVIDTTKLTPDKTTKIIIDHLQEGM